MNEESATEQAPADGNRSPSAPARDGEVFPKWLLNTGFLVALILALACLATASVYLFQYLSATQSSMTDLMSQAKVKQVDQSSLIFAMNASMVTSRLALLSCGILTGLCFAFLGFGLFLLGAKGDLDIEAARGESWSVKFARLSPGLFVILCGTVLIAACVLKPTPFYYQNTSGQSASDVPASAGFLPVDSRESVFGNPMPPDATVVAPVNAGGK